MKKNSRKPQKSAGVTRHRDWKPSFLEHLAQSGNVRIAAEAAGIGRQTAYNHRDSDKAFAQRWDAAMEDAADVLEAEARRRAVAGTDEPVIYEGKLQGLWVDADGKSVTEGTPGATLIPLTVKKYSDTLLIFLMKGARPQKYRDTHHHTHDGNLSIRSAAEGESEAAALVDDIAKRLGGADPAADPPA